MTLLAGAGVGTPVVGVLVGKLVGALVGVGVGANVLEDPRIALNWFVNELRQNGITLEAGMTVTTGTCATPIPIKAGDTVMADYGPLGHLEITDG